MVELAEKLKEGSLSPESVLYSYMDKVSDTSSTAKMLQGSPTVGLSNEKSAHFLREAAMLGITICQYCDV